MPDDKKTFLNESEKSFTFNNIECMILKKLKPLKWSEEKLRVLV